MPFDIPLIGLLSARMSVGAIENHDLARITVGFQIVGQKRLGLPAFCKDEGLTACTKFRKTSERGIECLEQRLGFTVGSDSFGALDQRIDLTEFFLQQPPLDRL